MSRNPFVWVIAVASLLAVSAVFVFHTMLEMAWPDAIYFTTSIITTVGFGDYNLRDAPAWMKIYGSFLMLAGAASTAAIFGGITDYLIRSQLAEYFGPKRVKMKNHIIVCGLENVGIRIVEQLHNIGEQVVVIEKDANNRFLEEVRALGIAVIIGDPLRSLEKANMKAARSLIAAEENDLLNLEIGLNARTANPQVQVVLRLFDHQLAQKIQSGFGFKTALSTSALAAPAFAMAAVDPSVQGTFYLGDTLMLTVELVLQNASTVAELKSHCPLTVLSFTRNGARHMHPQDTVALSAGDQVVVAVAPQDRKLLSRFTAKF